jgi:predicted nucleotidyltransferase
MKIREGLEIDDQRLADICRRYGIRELALFGSVLRDDFGAESDVDVLIALPRPSPIGLLDFVRCMHELQDLFGRSVDLVERDTVHWFIRDEVLKSARPVYVAAA